MKSAVFKFVLPVVILAAGGAAFWRLSAMRPTAAFAPPAQREEVVEIVEVHPEDLPLRITGSGSVQPARQVLITPEVTGKIVYLSEDLVPGARVKKGQILAKLDKRDYKLALTSQLSQLEQARLNYLLEQSRGAVARQEWEMLGGTPDTEQAQLALRTPHLEEAKVRTEAAQSALERARLALNKTVIRAPFDAIVVDKRADVGQLVGPGTAIASLMGSEELWVDVSIPIEHLSAFRIPGLNADTGSPATVIQELGGGKRIVRTGVVKRLKGMLDARNRTATVLVSVPSPFDKEGNQLPLLAGAYVTVTIEGQLLRGALRIPRHALREGHYVWTVRKGRLHKKEVVVAWKEPTSVVLSEGLDPGEQVVVSPLVFPVEGMRVRVLGGTDSAADTAQEGTHE